MSVRLGPPRSPFCLPGFKGPVLGLALILGIAPILKAQESVRESGLTFNAATGYSVENLNWSITGINASGESVNILSELKWKKPGGPYLHLAGEYAWKDLFVRSDLSKTFITSGKVSDTDFGKYNRRDTLFHDIFNSDKGGVISYSIAMGYKIRVLKKHTAAPFAGYRNDSQSLYLLRDNGNVQGDLKSTYQTKWNGLVAGLELRFNASERLTARGRITYHQVRYLAKADWNLIEDFQHPVSFKHRAKGYGHATEAGLAYVVGKKVSAILTVAHGYWTTGRGTDTLYRANGEIVVTALNPVHRSNLTFSAGVQMGFN